MSNTRKEKVKNLLKKKKYLNMTSVTSYKYLVCKVKLIIMYERGYNFILIKVKVTPMDLQCNPCKN